MQGIAALPAHLQVQRLTGHGDVMLQRLAVAADDMSNLIRRQANQPWSWSAMEAETRPVLALHGGDRRRKRPKRL